CSATWSGAPPSMAERVGCSTGGSRPRCGSPWEHCSGSASRCISCSSCICTP
ncbi:MAG: hypothetical protein AVDCRST_MAG21-1095, partial [uncultured Nocardioidaceae bacterium]